MRHAYWGTILEEWGDFQGEIEFSGFASKAQKCHVFLGESFHDDDDELLAPSPTKLDAYQMTYTRFLKHLPSV